MPVSEVRVPDGRVFEISHPEGASKEEIFAFAEYQYLQFEEPPERTMPVAPPAEEEEDTGMLSDIAEFGQRTLGAAGRILGQSPAGLQSLFREGMEEDEELVERNRAIEESIRSGLGYDDEYDDSTLGLAADVTGSVLGFGGTTLAGAALGSVVPGVGTLVGGVLGLGSGILLGAGSNVARGMEEAARQVERGEIVSDADYEKASTRLAAIGASEGLPFIGPTFRVLRRISGAAAKNPKAVETLGDYIRSAALQGTEEAAQEALAGIATDAVLKEYINPDIEIGDSLGVDLVAGGTAGALFDVGINLATRRRRTPADPEEDIKPFREELIAEEAALRENVELAEEARRERMGELATAPVDPVDATEVVMPELLEAGRAFAEPTPQEMKVIEKRRAQEELTSAERRILNEYKQRLPDEGSYNEIARRVVRQMGDQFPIEPEFYLDDDIDGMPGMVAIRDGSGRMYGSPVSADMAPKVQPAVAALNGQTVEENIFQSNRTAIAAAKEDYSPEQVRTLQRVGRIALGPESLSYSAEAANYAGGTTAETGFLPNLSAEKVIEAKLPRKKQTIAQRINVRRIKEGKVPSNRFAISEIRREIGRDVGRLAEYEAGAFGVDTYAALSTPIKGKFAVQPMSLSPSGQMEPSGDLIFDRPATAVERQAAKDAGKTARKRVPFASAAEAFAFAREANSRKGGSYIPTRELMGDPEFGIGKIKEILETKNISSPLNSPEVKNLASRFTGRKLRRDQSISDLTDAERQLFYQKLRQLPRFSSPTNIPLFKLRLRPEAEPAIEEQVQTETLELPSPAVPQGMDAATKGILERALESRLRQLGLTDYKTMVTNTLKAVARDADGNVYMRSLPEDQAAGALAEGGISVDGARVIQVAVDNIMARGVKPDNLEAAMVDVLNHEVVHALRELDVITEQELRLLQRLSSRYRKTSTGQTYADWAIETYGDTESDVNIAEEAIAEMIRDAISGRVIIDNKPAVVSGEPRSIINKIIKFFKGLIGVAQDVDPDYTSFTQFMNDLESGQIGARERGPIRTLYRLERETGQFIDRPAPMRTERQVETYEVETPTGTTVIETDSPEVAERTAEAMGGTATQTARAGDLMDEAGLGDMMLSRRADKSEAEADVSGQRPRDEDIFGQDRIAFSRRAADRNVEQSSNEAMADVAEYVTETSPDAAGMATIEAGPMAYSINSGFADQNGYAPTFTTPSRSWFQKIVFQVQDKLTDLKSIEDAINESRRARGLRPLKAAESAYTGEETLPGKIGEFDRRFKSNELEPLLKDMADSDVTLDQMDEFLVLRHAVERNDRVRKINPAIPDAGSGKWAGQELTDQYVKSKMLSDFGMKWNDSKGEWEGGNERGRTLSRLASRVDKINSTTLAISRKGELITEQEREFLDGFFKYYTPLRGIAQEEDIAAEIDERTAGSGGTLSIVGKEVKRLIGRKTEAISPLATIVTMRGTQAARAVKNTSFGKRLIKLIQENPNNDVWQLISPEDPKYKTAFDSSYTYVGPDRSRYGQKKSDISGEPDRKNWVKRVRVVQDPVFNPTGQELLGVKVDGQQYYVFFQNPELRKAAINLDAQSVGYLVEKLNGFTRFMSYVNTSLNPEFVMGNFPRDIETAIFNIVGEQTMEGGKALDAKGIIGQVLKNTIPSVRTFYKGFRNPDSLSAEDATNFREFITSGTKTDWFHSQPPEQQKKNLEMMAEMARGTFKGSAAQGFKAVKDFVDDSNNAVENGVRLATFVAARDAMIKSGMSRSDAIQQASTLAKNLTVNFNRKGNSGQLLNGLYLFFNASVQGTVNTMRGLNVFDPNSSRTKQAVVGSIMGFGALTTAIANALMGEDEFERIPDYIRDRNIIIPDALWGGNPETYSTIPLPYGYNVFWNLGENAYLVSAGQVSPENAAVRATNVFLGSFNPLGTSTSETYLGSLAKTGTPQFLKPVLELVMNENYFGSPIYPPDSPFGGGDDPLSRRSFSNTSQVWKSIAETVGTLTGGNESEPGLIEIPPDALSYLLSFYGGGAGSFAERTFFKVPDALMDPTRDLEVRDIPFVRRIRGEVDNRVDSESFYERRETLQRKDRQANDRLTGAERIAYIKENQDYIKMLPMLQGTEKTLRALRKSLRNLDKLQNVSPQRALEIAEQKRKIQERIDKTIERFNKRYDEVVGKTK